ncbi:MAG TPA: isochorismatase family protein [Azospirillaceae bacterium]|nr:isochorismatase family protein [Azospirillaceae bacterium]
MLIAAERSVLLVVDVQERLAPAIHGGEAATRAIEVLMRAAARLEVPRLVTEQYPAGLGATVPALAALTAPHERMEKIHFSAVAEPEFLARLGPRPDVVVCGFEAHVCVLQTTLGLLASGRRVCVVADGVSSRRPADAAAGLRRMAAAGAEVVTAEMVVFEWLRRAGTPEFKDLLRLIK